MEESKQTGQIRKSKTTEKFSIIPNAVLQRPDLSWKAKGLLAYLQSLPDDWKIFKTELHNHATDGHDSTVVAFNELMKHGYIERFEVRNNKGHFKGYDYIVYNSPIGDFPESEKPKSDNPEPEKPKSGNPQLQRKDSTKKPLSKVPKEPKKDPTILYLADMPVYGYEPDNREHLKQVIESNRIFIQERVGEKKLTITRAKAEEWLRLEHEQYYIAIQKFTIPAKDILDDFFHKANLNPFEGVGHFWNALKKAAERLIEKRAYSNGSTYIPPATPTQPVIHRQGVTATDKERAEIEAENARFLADLHGSKK